MTEQIIGQVLGILATIITFISYQANTKKSVLLILSAAICCTSLSYFFLGATSGFALNIVCLVRNAVFYFQKEGTKLQYISSGIFAVIMLCIGAMSWQGYISLFIMLALAINTVFLSFGKPQLLRKSILLTSTMVLIYNIFVFSIGGITNELIAIISAVVGIIRYRKA